MTAHTDAEDALAAYLLTEAAYRAAVAAVVTASHCDKYGCDGPSLALVTTTLTAMNAARVTLLAKLAADDLFIVPTP